MVPTFHDRSHPRLDYTIEYADLTYLYERFASKINYFHRYLSCQQLLSALQSSLLLLLAKFSVVHELISR